MTGTACREADKLTPRRFIIAHNQKANCPDLCAMHINLCALRGPSRLGRCPRHCHGEIEFEGVEKEDPGLTQRPGASDYAANSRSARDGPSRLACTYMGAAEAFAAPQTHSAIAGFAPGSQHVDQL